MIRIDEKKAETRRKTLLLSIIWLFDRDSRDSYNGWLVLNPHLVAHLIITKHNPDGSFQSPQNWVAFHPLYTANHLGRF